MVLLVDPSIDNFFLEKIEYRNLPVKGHWLVAAVETVRVACLVRVPPRQAYKDIVKSLQDWPWNSDQIFASRAEEALQSVAS